MDTEIPSQYKSCQQEPIHIPGSIQPHGVLLAMDAEYIIRIVSSNIGSMLACTAESLIGLPIRDLLAADDFAILQSAFVAEPIKRANPLKLRLSPAFSKARARVFDGILHRSGEFFVVELEPQSNFQTVSFGSLSMAMQKAIAMLQSSSGSAQLCEQMATEVRKLTGFDRVMVYRFAPDWHGEVIAESKREDMEPYLGLHYPAYDIPPQARSLYERNYLRIIPDANYSPSPLYPGAMTPSGQAFDMSDSVLRSVSPVHCKYLQNMGVAASMSISLPRDGSKLWGLIACHHATPKALPYELRIACELIARSGSLLISAHERMAFSQAMQSAQIIKPILIQKISALSSLDQGLHELPLEFLHAIEADGVCVLLNDKCTCIGTVPSENQTRNLAAWLDSQDRQAPFMTGCLSSHYPAGLEFASLASGVLSSPCGPENSEDRILWFRKELAQTVHWAGKPQSEGQASAEHTLSPRSSFALWKEIVKHTSKPWSLVDTAVAAEIVHDLHRLILSKVRETQRINEQLRENERVKDEFLAVISHELRTPLNAIMGWMEVLESGTLSSRELKEIYATIHRNAKTQKQLVEDLLDVSRIINGDLRLTIEKFSPRNILTDTVESIRAATDNQSIQFKVFLDDEVEWMVGDPCRFQQILWNLLSNALKFTQKGGTIELRLIDHPSCIEIRVADDGEGIDQDFLPFVFDRFRHADSKANRRHQGLGLGLSIVRQVVQLHGGTVIAHSAGKGQGATFTVNLPKNYFSLLGLKESENQESESLILKPDRLRGLSILVVEDSPDSRFLIQKVLEDLGAQIFCADSAKSALDILKHQRVDLLISDIGMPDIDGYTFMKIVRLLGIQKGFSLAAIALTAFASDRDRKKAIEAGFGAHLTKPFALSELVKTIEDLTCAHPQYHSTMN